MNIEKELDAPSLLSLRLLGLVWIFTLVPYLSSKVACNRRADVRSPLELPTEVFARDPESAGLELQQRARSHRYREAGELARGALALELWAADQRCREQPVPCQERRADAARVVTRAVVVARAAEHAVVRAESRSGADLERVTLQVRRFAGRWYVVSRAAFTGDLTRALTAAEAANASAQTSE